MTSILPDKRESSEISIGRLATGLQKEKLISNFNLIDSEVKPTDSFSCVGVGTLSRTSRTIFIRITTHLKLNLEDMFRSFNDHLRFKVELI